MEKKPSREQLVHGLKMSLASLEVNHRLGDSSARNDMDRGRLIELLVNEGELEDSPMVDLTPLLIWARDQLAREKAEL